MPNKRLHTEVLSELAAGQTELTAQCAAMNATMSSMKETMEHGFQYFKEQDEKRQTSIELKADKEDVKDLEDVVDVVKSKQNWIMGVGTTVAFIITTIMTWVGIHVAPPK